MKKILVIDDEISIVSVMRLVLEKKGYAVIDCFGPEEALRKLKTEKFDLMITDLRLNHRVDGLDLVDRAKLLQPKLPIIVMTAFSSVSIAVKAMKLGVYDFITKPFKMDHFLEVIENCLKNNDQALTMPTVEATEEKLHFGALLGESKSMQKVYSLIRKVAKTNSSVLIEGETGTGKELVAKAIHMASSRKKQPFHKVSCGSIVDSFIEKEVYGLNGEGEKEYTSFFETAHKGTLFLDKADKMSEKMQASVLRVMESRKLMHKGDHEEVELDFRIIAGTNQTASALLTVDNFCEDLYYQLSVIPIKLPALRHRVEDIPVIAAHFCASESKNLGHDISLSDEALECFTHYAWPGNVRELMNTISCAALLSENGLITSNELPPNLRENERNTLEVIETLQENQSLKEYIRHKEKAFITAILKKTNGNRVKAAKILGISRASLYRKLED
ncbi:MAG: sigma-54-dependent Fis family transcriptional regulator [Lentisphaeria bacterium]|nr:sigma-54-dependent Fis family transcriptional regulator [Lentisphaeria bacterium]